LVLTRQLGAILSEMARAKRPMNLCGPSPVASGAGVHLGQGLLQRRLPTGARERVHDAELALAIQRRAEVQRASAGIASGLLRWLKTRRRRAGAPASFSYRPADAQAPGAVRAAPRRFADSNCSAVSLTATPHRSGLLGPADVGLAGGL
jgi:hypothetical protein